MAKASAAKREKGGVVYRGVKYPGFNKPRRSNRKGKKGMVLAKKGDEIKVVHFGDSSMTDKSKGASKKKVKSYRARSGGIRNKSGKLTKNDKFSANYWSRKVNW